MTEQELITLQKQLDEQKYFQSEIVRQDLSGKMFYCEGCVFRHFADCQLTHENRVANCVCAKQEIKRGMKNEGSKNNGTDSVKNTRRKSTSKGR